LNHSLISLRPQLFTKMFNFFLFAHNIGGCDK
jgi:hypothetical protein